MIAMNSNSPIVTNGQKGFTLVELLVSMMLMGLVMAGAMNFFIFSARHYQDGSEHISFIDEARSAEQRILNIIQYARAVAVTPGNNTSLDIVQPDLTQSRLYLRDDDTPRDRLLMYDPDTDVVGDETEICKYVSGIPGKPMFQVFAGSNNTTQISLYVGLRPPEDETRAAIRKSYTGANVYLTASPRNTIDVIQR